MKQRSTRTKGVPPYVPGPEDGLGHQAWLWRRACRTGLRLEDYLEQLSPEARDAFYRATFAFVDVMAGVVGHEDNSSL